MTAPLHYSPELCQATTYKPELLRRTGRGKYGFERHFTEEQCRRRIKQGQKYCYQHKYLEQSEELEDGKIY